MKKTPQFIDYKYFLTYTVKTDIMQFACRLGRDSIILKTNQELKELKNELEKNEKEKNVIKHPETDKAQETFLGKIKSLCSSKTKKKEENKTSVKNLTTPDERSNYSDENRKTKDEKLKTFSSLCTKKKNKNNLGIKKFNIDTKRSKHEIDKSIKSLRSYIKQKWKWVTFLFVIYTVIVAAVVSTPAVATHFRVINRIETEQERSIA